MVGPSPPRMDNLTAAWRFWAMVRRFVTTKGATLKLNCGWFVMLGTINSDAYADGCEVV